MSRPVGIDPNIRLLAGDVVALSGVVVWDEPPGQEFVTVKIDGMHNSRPPVLVVERGRCSLASPAFQRGDRIYRFVEPSAFGRILALHDDKAWVQFESGDVCTCLLSHIERAPEPGESGEAVAPAYRRD